MGIRYFFLWWKTGLLAGDFFFVRELRKSRSLHALGDTSETQHADYKHLKTLSFPHRYSTTVEPKFLQDLQILKEKKEAAKFRATLPTQADWFPIACLSCRLFSLSLICWTVVFDFMLALFSPAFFTKVVGACLAVLWNVQGKKKRETTEMQEKCALFNYWAWSFIYSFGTTNYLRWFQTGIQGRSQLFD